MADETRLQALLLNWEEMKEQGQRVSIADLCRSTPQLAKALQDRIQRLEAMDQVFQITDAPRTVAPAESDTVEGLAPGIAGYEILGELGRGGMGVVYRARQLNLDRPVALKMILARAYLSRVDLSRLRAEAIKLARVQHVHIVPVYDIGEQDGHPYFTMELMEGGSLAEKLAGNPQVPAFTAPLVETLVRAIHVAHERGVIHRDLKPANILLTADGTPKISDFGLAKSSRPGGASGASGTVVGTPSYMAPEQARGQMMAVGPATDVYALGAILYECLTGRPPFRGDTTFATITQVLSEEPVRPSLIQRTLPADLETICLKCLQKEPARRYASAAALAEDLRRFQEGRPIQARPVSVAEKVWRWGRRNPIPASLLALLVLVFLIGVIGVFTQWQRAEAEMTTAQIERSEARRQQGIAEAARGKADEQRQEAEKNLAQANRAIQDLVKLVSYLDSTQLLYLSFADLTPKAVEALVAYYEDFLRQHETDASKRVEIANAHFRIARFNRQLNRDPEALPHAQQAMEICAALVRENPEMLDFQRDLAASWASYGFLHHAIGVFRSPGMSLNSASGLPYILKSLELRQRIYQDHLENLDYRNELAQTYNSLGLLCNGMRELQQSEAYLLEAIGHHEEVCRRAPQIARYQFGLANSYFNLANTNLSQERLADAVALGRKMLALFPRDPEMHFRLVRILAAAGKRTDPRTQTAGSRQYYLDEAMAVLQESIRYGFNDVVRLNTAGLDGLELLRLRQDYQQLVQKLEAKQTLPRGDSSGR